MQNFLIKIKHHFEKGGKLERLYPLYEMTFTLLFVTPERTKKGCHVRDHYDVKRMMVTVIFAMVPVSIFGIFNTGYQHYLSMGVNPGIIDSLLKGAVVVLPLYIVVYVVGGFWEILFAVVRKHEINEGLLVSGFILPLILPPETPLWQVAIATTFGIVIGKELFGGTGMNIFNPAMVARAFLFFSYPASISGNKVWTAFGDKVVDTYTMATPLSIASSNSSGVLIDHLSRSGYSFWKMFIGLIPGSVGETSTLLILLGAALLIISGVGSWRIIVSVFTGGILMVLLMNFLAPSNSSILSLPPHYHLVMGGFAFGAVFMATDPVSAAATNTGKYIYGFFIGVLAILVRTVNPAYPEGMMLAILFMNAMSPLVDQVVVWRNVRRRLKRAKG